MKTKLVITDSEEVFQSYRENNIALKNNSRTVWLHTKESFEKFIETVEDCRTYEFHLLDGYKDTYVHQAQEARKLVVEICNATNKHVLCKSCDFYNIIPTLQEDMQIQKPLCGAGKMLEGVRIESCGDYEEKDIQQRVERERALSAKVTRNDDGLVQRIITYGNAARNIPFGIIGNGLMPPLQPHQRAMLAHNELVGAYPEVSPAIEIPINDINAIKAYLRSPWTDEMFPIHVSRNEANRMILRRIINVLQREQSRIENNTHVICNVLLIGRDYYHQLYITATSKLRTWANQESNSRMFEDYIWQYTRLKVVRTIDEDFKLVFDPSISE